MKMVLSLKILSWLMFSMKGAKYMKDYTLWPLMSLCVPLISREGSFASTDHAFGNPPTSPHLSFRFPSSGVKNR